MNTHFLVSFGWEAHLHMHELEVKHQDDVENGLWLLYDNTTNTYRGPMFHTYDELLEWIYIFTTMHEAW